MGAKYGRPEMLPADVPDWLENGGGSRSLGATRHAAWQVDPRQVARPAALSPKLTATSAANGQLPLCSSRAQPRCATPSKLVKPGLPKSSR